MAELNDYKTPPQVGVGFINLEYYVGQDLLIEVLDRRDFETKFGARAAVLCELRTVKRLEKGWVFAAQFVAMEVGAKYAGRLERNRNRWELTNIDEARIKKILAAKPERVESTVSDDDVPF